MENRNFYNVSLTGWIRQALPQVEEIIFFFPTLTSTTFSHRGGKLFIAIINSGKFC